MRLLKTSTPNKSLQGFSLIELLVVVSLFAIIGSVSLVVSMANYRGSAFEESQAVLISALQKARSQAMSGVCIGSGCRAGQPHGLHISPIELVIFQGSSYTAGDDTNEYIPLPSAVVTFGGMSDVVFAELSGDATPAGDIVLSDASGHVATTTIGAEGQINW